MNAVERIPAPKPSQIKPSIPSKNSVFRTSSAQHISLISPYQNNIIPTQSNHPIAGPSTSPDAEVRRPKLVRTKAEILASLNKYMKEQDKQKQLQASPVPSPILVQNENIFIQSPVLSTEIGTLSPSEKESSNPKNSFEFRFDEEDELQEVFHSRSSTPDTIHSYGLHGLTPPSVEVSPTTMGNYLLGPVLSFPSHSSKPSTTAWKMVEHLNSSQPKDDMKNTKPKKRGRPPKSVREEERNSKKPRCSK